MNDDQKANQKERARQLRKNMTFPERRLWQALRGRRLAGLKFVRQSPIGNFIADFVCREKKLVLEVDGESHADRRDYDEMRQRRIEQAGYHVVRVSNDDVLQNLEGALAMIIGAAGLDVAQWQDGVYGRLPEGID